MRNFFLILITTLPYFVNAQDDTPIVFSNREYIGPYFSIEKAHMSDERWVIFDDPSGRIRISNLGDITIQDSIGNSVTETIHCDVYPIIAKVVNSVFLQEYYWYSKTNFLEKKGLQNTGYQDETNQMFASIDGKEFTFQGPPERFLDYYQKKYPDAILVAKLPYGVGKILTHN